MKIIGYCLNCELGFCLITKLKYSIKGFRKVLNTPAPPKEKTRGQSLLRSSMLLHNSIACINTKQATPNFGIVLCLFVVNCSQKSWGCFFSCKSNYLWKATLFLKSCSELVPCLKGDMGKRVLNTGKTKLSNTASLQEKLMKKCHRNIWFQTSTLHVNNLIHDIACHCLFVDTSDACQARKPA